MLGALINVPAGIGYPVLFGFVAAESAGALVPGETALIVAAARAADGQLSLPLVIAIAAVSAIIGDNIGYQLGRRGLRRLLDRPGRWSGRRQQVIARGEAFFARHGSAAVFFGRWLPGLRVVASWLAGAEHMPWPRFLVWNALGGIAWAATIGGLAFARDRCDLVGDAQVLLHVALGEARVVAAKVTLAEIRRRAETTRQEAATEGRVGDEADAELADERQDLRRGIARPERILGLERR